MENIQQFLKSSYSQQLPTDRFPCDSCGHVHLLDIQPRERSPRLVEYGHTCPHCHHWFHSFYMTPPLVRQWKILHRFRRKAGRGEQAFRRYKRRKELFQRQFQREQQRIKIAMKEAI